MGCSIAFKIPNGFPGKLRKNDYNSRTLSNQKGVRRPNQLSPFFQKILGTNLGTNCKCCSETNWIELDSLDSTLRQPLGALTYILLIIFRTDVASVSSAVESRRRFRFFRI